MPPKKAKSGKKGKKGKKSAGKSSRPEVPQVEVVTEGTRDFFGVQIKDLETRLTRYQRRCDELEVSNKGFKGHFDQLTNDKQDIVSFLKKSLEQRGDEIADMQDRLVGLQQAKETEKDGYEGQLQSLRTEFQETKDKLTTDNMVLNGRLASLEEFRVQREELMKKFEELEKELSQQEDEHKEKIYDLEKKAVIDKDRLKKDMVMRVNQVAAEFRKVSNKQMAETTKRTIRENVSINAQLTKMSDKTLELIQENEELRTKEKKQRQHIELLENNEKELAKKNHSNQKIIRMLTEKCKEQEAMIAELDDRDHQYGDLESENSLLKDQVEATRDQLQKLDREIEETKDELEAGKTELSKRRRHAQKLETVLAEAAAAIKAGLTATKPGEEEDEAGLVARKETMLSSLMSLLDSAASLGVGPAPADLGKQFSVRAQSAEKSRGKAGRMSPLSGAGGGALPHYQLGDLGLVPRPQHQLPKYSEKMRALSPTTRMSQMRKVLSRPAATQTASGPKAMFFADEILSQVPRDQRQSILHGKSRGKSRDSGTPIELPPVHQHGQPSKVF